MEYEHKGVKIKFDGDRAQFSAVINGVSKKTASLSSIKKIIDASTEFKQFTAIDMKYMDHELKVVTVVGTFRNPGRFGALVWKLNGAGGERHSVCVDTPQNRAAIKAWMDAKEAEETRHLKAKEATEKLRLSIKMLKPEE